MVEVLHSTAVVREEIEHQCAALECTSTLTDFTEAMIEGRSMKHTYTLALILLYIAPFLRPIQERMRIHQSVNKLIEQAKVHIHYTFSYCFMSSFVDDFVKYINCLSCLQ